MFGLLLWVQDVVTSGVSVWVGFGLGGAWMGGRVGGGGLCRCTRRPPHPTHVMHRPHFALAPHLTQAPRPPLRAGLLIEVHKMSKFIHGSAVLFPDLVQVLRKRALCG